MGDQVWANNDATNESCTNGFHTFMFLSRPIVCTMYMFLGIGAGAFKNSSLLWTSPLLLINYFVLGIQNLSNQILLIWNRVANRITISSPIPSVCQQTLGMISLLTGMGPQTLYSLRFWLIQSLHLKRKSHVVTVKNPSLCSNRYFTEKSSLPHPKIVESWGGGGYFPPVFQLNKIFFSYILTEAISENHHLLWLLWLEECNWRTRENCHFF